MANDKFCVECGKPYFSDSREHDNEPLCASHYKDWLANKDARKLQKLKEEAAILEATMEAKSKATGGKTK